MRLYDEKIVQQRIIGYIIRHERKKYKIKMTDFVAEFGKTRQYYSKIEHGDTSLSFSTLGSIFEYLGINFNYSYYYQINSLMDDFIDHLFFGEYEKAKCALSKILSHKDWKYSYSYPKVFLAELYQELLNEKPFPHINKNDFIILESFFNEDKYLSLFYLGFGYSSLLKKEYDFSIEMLNLALRYAEKPSLKSLSYLYLSIVYIAIHQYIYALDYIQNASQIYKKENNPNKDVITQYYTAEIFSSLLYPKHAIKYYKSCIIIAKRLNLEKWYKQAYINLTWNALFTGDYNLVIQYGLAAQNYINDSNISFCLSYSYLMLNYQKEAYKYFNEINTKDSLMSYYKKLLNALLKHNFENQIHALFRIYDHAQKKSMYPMLQFVNKSLKDIALQKHDYKTASYYTEKSINLRKNIGAMQKVDHDEFIR